MTSCTAIEFCDLTLTLTNNNYLHNLCPKCMEGFTYFYNETTKLIEFNKCTPILSSVLSSGVDLGTNCLAADDSKCVICKVGTSLDPRGFCQHYKDNNCEGSIVQFLNNNFVGVISGVTITNQAIYWANAKSNCAKCRSTFINVSFQEHHSRCFSTVEREIIVYTSSDTSSPPGRLLQTASLPDCDSVDIIDSTICVTCKSGFFQHPVLKSCHQILNCDDQQFIEGTVFPLK